MIEKRKPESRLGDVADQPELLDALYSLKNLSRKGVEGVLEKYEMDLSEEDQGMLLTRLISIDSERGSKYGFKTSPEGGAIWDPREVKALRGKLESELRGIEMPEVSPKKETREAGLRQRGDSVEKVERSKEAKDANDFINAMIVGNGMNEFQIREFLEERGYDPLEGEIKDLEALQAVIEQSLNTAGSGRRFSLPVPQAQKIIEEMVRK